MNQFTDLFDRMATGVEAFGRSVTRATNPGVAVASRRTALRSLLGRIARDARDRREATKSETTGPITRQILES